MTVLARTSSNFTDQKSIDISEAHITSIFRVQKQVEQETNVKAGLLATCVQTGFFLYLFLDLEDGGNMFLRKVGWFSSDYTTLYPRRRNIS
jgi:hypothetical protein